jgi:hypothetical protein
MSACRAWRAGVSHRLRAISSLNSRGDFTRGATMTEETIFIQRRISHYVAMLKLDLNDKKRAKLNRLIKEDEQKLETALHDEQNPHMSW